MILTFISFYVCVWGGEASTIIVALPLILLITSNSTIETKVIWESLKPIKIILI
jgi:hypothetical protein